MVYNFFIVIRRFYETKRNLSRQRKVFAPYGISYTKKTQASLSPTDAELENGSNWELVNNGSTSKKSYINHKAIPIARIISKG